MTRALLKTVNINTSAVDEIEDSVVWELGRKLLMPAAPPIPYL